VPVRDREGAGRYGKGELQIGLRGRQEQVLVRDREGSGRYGKGESYE
jgi:hypothetical protein